MKKAFLVLCILTLLCILSASAADVYPEITVTGFEFLVNGVPGNSISEGLCFQCAAELGIKPPPVVDMLKKMGIDECHFSS